MSIMTTLLWNFVAYVFLTVAFVSGSPEKIKLENNGYSGIVIAINPEVAEDTQLIEKLKELWTDASAVLWKATKNRAYFANITILVPKNWTQNAYLNSAIESYNTADIIVANPNPVYQNAPYTLQYGLCGEPGEYIHLTPDYIKNDAYIDDYGPKGNTLVHEWAHLRWGVFDEASSDGYDSFYWDGRQELQATRCPTSLQGEYVIADDSIGLKWRRCNINQKTGLPEDGCVFIPYDKQLNNFDVSIMSHQYLDNVVTFCHDDESDPMNLHNKEAPNEQNRLCDYRSAWDVITSSSDFNGTNPSNIENFVPPNFLVVKPQSTYKSVLVLDTSGSMSSNNKLEDMVTAADLFILQYAPSGSKLGIVEFESSAIVSSKLVIIDSKDSRNKLASHLPNNAGGGTCIDCGILEAIKVLEKDGDAAGSHVLVLTDGLGTVKSAIDDVFAKGIVVDTIFFGEDAGNLDLQALSEDTGGTWFFNEEGDMSALVESFQQLGKTNDGNVFEENFQVYGGTFEILGLSFTTGFTDVDSTIGNNTAFTFTWSQYDAPIVSLFDPNGNKYCSKSLLQCIDEADVNPGRKTIIFSINGTAIAGRWTYNITNPTAHSQTISLTVTSMASDPDVKPIVVEAGMSSTDVSSLSPIVVYAKVTKGYEPVLGADVEAIVSSATGEETKLTLLDTGSTPDVREVDGVYSRYFTQYTAQGRYSVKVNVLGKGNKTDSNRLSSIFRVKRSKASFNPGVILEDGTVVANPNLVGSGGANVEAGVKSSELDPFSRVTSPGGFYYSGPMITTSADVFPPSKVLNLQASQLDIEDVNNGIVLTFAAPGSDFDSGTASFYEIRYTFDGASVLSNSFENGAEVTEAIVVEGNISQPKIAGEQETYVVKLVDIPIAKETVNAWFAVRAHDDATPRNVAPVSNIAMMSVFYVVPTLNTVTDVTTTTTAPKDYEDYELYRILTISFGCATFALLCALICTIIVHCKLKSAHKKLHSSTINGMKMAWAESKRSSALPRPNYRINPTYSPDKLDF